MGQSRGMKQGMAEHASREPEAVQPEEDWMVRGSVWEAAREHAVGPDRLEATYNLKGKQQQVPSCTEACLAVFWDASCLARQ